jgi:predicted NAD/FAD-dependent oxidoreductase
VNLSCLVVGAGLAGLLAARALKAEGFDVVIVDKGRGVGGRMATRRIDLAGGATATFDHGAQYFTVRSDRFRALVEAWIDAGVVVRWSQGFATPDASAYRDGHPRYRGVAGMTTIAKYLAQDLDVRRGCRIQSLRHEDSWQATAEDGNRFAAAALVLTPPVPQTLALLDAGKVVLPKTARQALDRIDYDPCFAVLAALDGPSQIPAPGGLWPGSQIISWMADNQQKGISTLSAVTIHGSQEFSAEHFDEDPHAVAQLLLQEAALWLGANVITYQVQRWRYSIPVHMHGEPSLFVTAPGPVAFAGDAFAGPRIEGAALSGLAAADALLDFYRNSVS